MEGSGLASIVAIHMHASSGPVPGGLGAGDSPAGFVEVDEASVPAGLACAVMVRADAQVNGLTKRDLQERYPGWRFVG